MQKLQDESEIGQKVRNTLTKSLLLLIALGLAYLLVYKLSYLPNGYEIIFQQQNVLHIQEYNLFLILYKSSKGEKFLGELSEWCKGFFCLLNFTAKTRTY
ncbi:hypothetical protein GLW08_00290 [Pontibacillus yanchengensis]|uniref:Uncharacterized protein n=1 Tax=Pontibacillus yanchengensis TaxID=462910 RepID=A0ACC7VAT0_9BACI|nr:hypothetical protein [Pontibacillus yanchengensis]MYL51768.1 hypothetical protein [Pontibacillus yanchengensis]